MKEKFIKSNRLNILFGIYVLISILVSLFFIFLYKFDSEKIVSTIIDPKINYNTQQYYYGIDPINLTSNDEKLVIQGWIVNKNKDLEYVNREVILINQNGEAFKIKTVAYDRDLTSFYDNGFNYDLGGIWAECFTDKIEDGEYKIAFICQESDGTSYFFDLGTRVKIGG